MLAHLWTGAPAPWRYTELILCRDVYHCTPVELAQVPLDVILDHLAALSAESEVAQLERMKRR